MARQTKKATVKGKRGRPSARLKIKGDWGDAVARALQKGPYPGRKRP